MKLIAIYRCLCDESRLRILHLLQREPLCVCQLQAALRLPQVAVSKHLAYLRRHGLVAARRQGQWMRYRLPARRPRELDLQLQCLQDCLQAHTVFQKDLQRLSSVAPRCAPAAAATSAAVPSHHE
jgi:ArsR family transcriptional regulator